MHRCFLSLSLLLFSLLLSAQNTATSQLLHWLKSAYRFDHEYPREKVMLYPNQSAYMEGDTLWYKAFVVRASSLRPEPLSRVLYVELLNDQGQMMERSRLRLDSLGQAHGHFDLSLPKRAGFYELRAYTRAMTNWGEHAVYSRVFPLFEVPQKDEALRIAYPQDEHDLLPGHERPYRWGKESERLLTFFPEGGARIAGLPQRIAYLLTDGRGNPVTDTLNLYPSDGELLLQSVPEHQGMGSFLLPEGFAEGYVQVGKNRFELPVAQPEGCVLTLDAGQGSRQLILQMPQAEDVEVGAVIFAHERPVWFNAFPVNREGTQLEIPDSVLRRGVHRLEIFDREGRSLARRMFYHHRASHHTPTIHVRQNAQSYAPFAPIALDIEVKDAQGRGLATQLCLNVSDSEAPLVDDVTASLETQLLLASELRGYIHRPEQYFPAKPSAATRRSLDLLMQVQGWLPTPFEQMCGRDSFPHPQPIEDRLILRGQLLRDNDRQQGMAGMRLRLNMFSLAGGRAEGETLTDATGHFAFASNVDYVGPWTAIFQSADAEKGKRRWTRLTLDQWFNPKPRPFHPLEFQLYSPVDRRRSSTASYAPELFAWTDTIPHRNHYYLKAAEVKSTRLTRYKGLRFDRYSYGGGERVGMKYANIYFNLPFELDRAKDRGLSFHSYTEFLSYLFHDFDERHALEEGEVGSKDLSEHNAAEERQRELAARGERPTPPASRDNLDYLRSREERAGVKRDSQLAYLTYRGQPVHVVFNNGAGVAGGDYNNVSPEELRSAMLSLNGGYHLHGATIESLSDHVLYLYTQPNWIQQRERRGENRRVLHGFAQPLPFPAPNYREADLPKANDLRRTLFWQPSLTTNADGRATAIFFNNARTGQQPRISLRGITASGEIISFDR